jgi:hypothetical protein
VIGWQRQLSGEPARAFGAGRSISGRRQQLHDLGFANGYSLGEQSRATFDEHGRARLAWRSGGAVNAARAHLARP